VFYWLCDVCSLVDIVNVIVTSLFVYDTVTCSFSVPFQETRVVIGSKLAGFNGQVVGMEVSALLQKEFSSK